MDWRSIDGWLTEAEGDTLATLATGKRVLELGGHKGRSTVCMARTAREVVSVDWHRGDADTGPIESQAEFAKNTGKLSNVRGVESRFEMLPDDLLKSGFDLVFIDGQHDTASVERDTLIAKKTGAPVIAFHDGTYQSVRRGARLAGFNLRMLADSLAVGAPVPSVVLVQPRYGEVVHWEADHTIWNQPSLHMCDVIGPYQYCNNIAYAFNKLKAAALDERDAGRATHMAMAHADIVAEPGWLDVLYSEMDANGADLISTCVPIRDDDPNPRMSTAVGSRWNEWFPHRFITKKDRETLPPTFGVGDVSNNPDDVLLVNSGLWLADLRKPWWDFFDFAMDSKTERYQGNRIIQQRSEDWQMSRFIAKHGGNVAATWAVKVKHMGEHAWTNY